MVYKRATQQLRDAGILDIDICESLWGPCPEYPGLFGLWQTSKCFATPTQAAQAVIDGYRPTVSARRANALP